MIKCKRVDFDYNLLHDKYIKRLKDLATEKNGKLFRKKLDDVLVQSNFKKIVEPYLIETFNGKCAFCERKVNSNSVDFFRPKSNARDLTREYSELHYWWLSLEYKNTCLLCSSCNSNKGSWFPVVGKRAKLGTKFPDILGEENLIIDPCYDDAEVEFVYSILGKVSSGSLMGKTTIDVLKLNRDELVVARRKAWVSEKGKFNLVKNDQQKLNFYLGDLFFKDQEEHLGIKRFFVKKSLQQLKAKHPKLSTIIEVIKVKYKNSENEPKRLEYLKRRTDPKSLSKIISEEDGLRNNFVKSIVIKNFRGISNLKLAIQNSEKRTPCMFIIGENGTGKSSILKAIVLALSNSRYYNKNLSKLDLSNGKGKGSIRIVFDNGKETELNYTYLNNKLVPHYNNKFSYNTIIGYGSSRLAGIKGYYKPEQNIFDNKIKNLFNPSIPLKSPIEWIYGLTDKEFKSASERLAEILDLNEGNDIEKGENKKLLIKRGVKSIPYELLSDGNKVLFAVACDLMSSLNSESGDYIDIEAIVIIDEIENHLHPRWKMRITNQLRNTFPKIQFIFSTHDPLCIKGADKGETILLKEEKKGKINAIYELPNPSLLTAEQLLTSEYFGLSSTLDLETERRFNEYYKLLSINNKNEEIKDKITQFKNLLRSEGQLGKTLRDELMYSAIDEMIMKQLFSSQPMDRIKLKEETYKLIKESFDKL